MKALRQIIINGSKCELRDLVLCIDSLFANTSMEKVETFIAVPQDQEFYHYLQAKQKQNLGSKIKFFVTKTNTLAEIFTIISEELDLSISVALLNASAVVSQGWIDALDLSVRQDNVVAAISRKIVRPGYKNLINTTPYAKSSHDVDIALSASSNQLLDPSFKEIMSLAQVRKISDFCTLIELEKLPQGLMASFNGLGDESWISIVSSRIQSLSSSSIVYTPDSKVYDISYFY